MTHPREFKVGDLVEIDDASCAHFEGMFHFRPQFGIVCGFHEDVLWNPGYPVRVFLYPESRDGESYNFRAYELTKIVDADRVAALRLGFPEFFERVGL